MPGSTKAQRVRDPVHNLIEFGPDQFESTLWRVIQTRPFQRLRRIRQLGFSELVFPGAVHTRFSHSIGVFHTARQLMELIKRELGNDVKEHQLKVALAAALVHDVGHGMFSHSFEEVGKGLDLSSMARHERVSERLIRDSEISVEFEELGSGFADDVADILGQKEPANLYGSVVSSQFDADRLDYMQRDRLMTGVQSSGIDATWLISNLEIGKVPSRADEARASAVETLVLGPKAFYAAENYVLSLFQLYPNVYFHKTTRAAEKLFSCLMARVLKLGRGRHMGTVGLPKSHPVRRFAEEPSDMGKAQALDDTVFWGALSMMAEAKDPLIRGCALRLRDRKLPKCIDIRRLLEEDQPADMPFKERRANVNIACKNIVPAILEQAGTRGPTEPQIFVDVTRREPYKKIKGSESPLNRILIKHGEGRFEDMAYLSPVVESAETFEVCRAYHDEDDTEGQTVIENIIRTYRLNREER